MDAKAEAKAKEAKRLARREAISGKVNWSRPYFKEFNAKLINQLGMLGAIIVLSMVVVGLFGDMVWVTRLGILLILITGVLIGGIGATQAINKREIAEQKKEKVD